MLRTIEKTTLIIIKKKKKIGILTGHVCSKELNHVFERFLAARTINKYQMVLKGILIWTHMGKVAEN